MHSIELQILLHYHDHPGDFMEGDFRTDAVRQAVEWLKAMRLIERNGLASAQSAYIISERGRVFIDAVLKLPLPVEKWVMPDSPQAS